MYAVIETGGKQYRVEVGTELEVEYLDVQPGSAITLDRVLLVADGAQASIGRPIVADATVSAEVLRQDRGEKLISFKYRPKARSRVKKGHRQELTILRITDVRLGDRSAAAEVQAAAELARTERERLQEAAARQAAVDAELASKLAKERPAPAEAAEPKKGRATPKAAATPPAKAAAKAPAKATSTSTPKAAGKGAKADSTPASEGSRRARPKKDS